MAAQKTAWKDLSLRIIPALLLVQSLFFKFSAAPESVLLFTTIGMEPFGRIGIGVAELIASAMLLYRPLAFWGALGSLGLMAGALFFHLFTPLGVAIALPQGGNDGGVLFLMALAIFLLSLLIAYFHRSAISGIIQK